MKLTDINGQIPRIRKAGTATKKSMTTYIARNSTYSKSDIVGAISALEDAIKYYLNSADNFVMKSRNVS